MIFYIWLIIFALLILTIYNPAFFWLAGVLYFVGMFIRAFVKYKDYNEWLLINKRDEGLELEKVRNDMANRGLTFSGIRNQAENKVKQDFEFERKKAYRKLWIDLADSLFLR